MKRVYILLLFCISFLVSCGFDANLEAQNNANIENLEKPALNKNSNEIVIERMGYIVSYNPQTLNPNWVAWELYPEKLVEEVSRYSKFLPDPDVRDNIKVTTYEYTHSGWNRGHMCPAADNKWDSQAMKESFYMTNVCPQNENLNKGDWNDLEEACREWAMNESIYIVCGPIFYDEPVYGFIGKEFKIRIPDAFFKVVLKGVESGNPQAIGFIFKNESGNHKLYKYVNSIDQVERITGIDFFPALPDEVENKVEAEYDVKLWDLRK